MVFDFTITYLGFLKNVPVLPHLFEGLLKLETFVINRTVLDYIDDIETAVLSWDHISVHPHKFGGTQFDVNNKEIGHIHGNGLLDVPFSRSTKEQLMSEFEKVKDHHIFKNSGWISLYISDTADKDLAIHILSRSYHEKLNK